MIKAEGLGYHSRKFKMQDVSFELEDGYILTLLGKNGAGKTTLLDMLYGVLKPNKGHVYWNDVDVTGVQAIEAQAEYGHFRDEVAYVSDKVWCMDEIPVEKNIALFSGLYQHWDAERFETILERLRFPKERLQERYGELSTGQKMQVQIAFHLARNPRLLLMDEPMANLDPVVKTDFWDLLSHQCRDEDMGLIISTHLVEEINDITDYIAVLKDGNIAAYGECGRLLSENQCSDVRELMRRLG